MSIVELRNVAKRYGKKSVLTNINLAVESGDFMVVYGLPTSGKSVLVRLLTGLEKADQGQIVLRGRDITSAAPGDRNIGYVPQSFALYPHYTVYQNIAYPLTLVRAAKTEIEPAVQRVAKLLGIEPLLERKPDQLSGGQKQRVAIARGLVKKTDVYVLDDPLVGLDFKLRERLIEDLKQTQEVLGVTFLYTTSDAVETLMLAKHIAVMDGGEIVEHGPPETLYRQPQRAETMRYLGFPQTNFLAGELRQNGARWTVQTALFSTPVQLTAPPANLPGRAIAVGIRPEHVQLGLELPPTMLTNQAKVLLREDLGGEEIVYLTVGEQTVRTVLRSDDRLQQHVEIDQTATIGIRPADVILYADGVRIGCGQ